MNSFEDAQNEQLKALAEKQDEATRLTNDKQAAQAEQRPKGFDGSSCKTPFDCGSQFKCVDGKCVTRPECAEDTNGCEDPAGNCLGPGAIPVPDPDTPNCGLGDPNTNPFARRDCIFNCNIFCDEWDKISANLTDDTEIKDCHIDDACSACKSCQPGPDSPDEEAVRKAFDAAIQEVRDNLAIREQEQEEELEDLAEERDEDLKIIKEELEEIADEISDLNEAILEDPQNEALRQERNDKITEQNDKRQEGYDREQQYRDDKRAMEEQHRAERDAYYDQIDDLQEEKTDRLKAMKNRGVCKNKKAGVDRPCYCPAYIDEDTNKLVDDGKGRECYLCNTESGAWEYKSDLCTLSCSRCIVCDNGEEVCATVNLPENEAGDICKKARKKAEKRCKKLEPLEERCPYPSVACEVEGPNPGGNITAEVAENGTLQVLQGGANSLQTANGELAKLAIQVSEDATGQFSLICASANYNGGKIKPLRSQTFFTIVGSEERPDEKLEGKPKVIGSFVGSEFAQADVTEVISSEGEAAVYEYRWFLDKEMVTWSSQRYPMNDEGNQYNPEEKYFEGMPIEEQEFLVTDDDKGKLIQVGVRLKREGEAVDESRRLAMSDPAGPMKAAPIDFTQGAITLIGSGTTYSALTVDLSELEQLYYPDYFPILIDWIAVDTGQSVSASDHVFLREWAEGRVIYAVATIFDNDGDPRTWISESVGPITAGGPPADEPSEDSSSVTVQMSGATVQGERLSVDAQWSLANGKAAGPFYTWYINGELVYGLWNNSVNLTQRTVNNYVSASVTVYDNYGTPYSGDVQSDDTIQNEPSVATGNAWLLGPVPPSEGNTLRIINNIEDEDGFAEGIDGRKGGIQYQWQSTSGNIKGATEKTLKLAPELGLVDDAVRCLVYWTTDFGAEKVIATEFTDPILPGGGEYRISAGPDQLDVSTGVTLIVPIIISGPTEDVSISDAYHTWYITHGGQGTVQFVPNSSVAQPGALVADLWDDDGLEEGVCEEGWDCYETQLDPNTGEDAPLGSTYFVKCPYPGYPELTYEESLDKDCKKLCADYCYGWSVTRPEGDAPILGDDTRILNVYTSDGQDIYMLETCAPHPDGEEACPPNFKNNYISVWRLQTPEVNAWRCTCEAASGETFRIESAIEYSLSTPGFGPWSLDPTWGEYYPICGEDKEFPPEGVEGSGTQVGNPAVPCIEGSRNFGNALFGCQANISSADRGEAICARRSRGFNRTIKQFSFCGNFYRDPKPNPQRGFIIEDREGKLNVQYHGYSLWPFVYRQWMINGVLDSQQFDTGKVTGSLSWRPRLFNPGVPAESLPPRCVGAPTQVAYYSMADDTFYSTLETYIEIVGEVWYKCNKLPRDLDGAIGSVELCDRCDGDSSGGGSGGGGGPNGPGGGDGDGGGEGGSGGGGGGGGFRDCEPGLRLTTGRLSGL